MRALLFGLVLLGGCATDEESSGGQPVGRVCTSSDQCADGLDCLAQPGDDPWCDQESYCSVDCIDDDECLEALGEGHICVQDCGASLCFEGSSSG